MAAFFALHSARGDDRIRLYPSDPSIAARGFTGVAQCKDLTCIHFNPAQLQSTDENARPFFGVSLQFNDALYNVANNWSDVKGLYTSGNQEQLLDRAYHLASRQTLQGSGEFGLRLRGFVLSYTPFQRGVVLLLHDPVLPYVNAYYWETTSIAAGYGFTVLEPRASIVRAVKTGLVTRYMSSRADAASFETTISKVVSHISSSSSYARARLGTTVELNVPTELTLSAVASGIPIAGKIPDSYPKLDELDYQFGSTFGLYHARWARLTLLHTIDRTFQSDAFILKNHFGLQFRSGAIEVGTGYHDAGFSYGLKFKLPLIAISFASYRAEYSYFPNSVVDRVYWVKLEI